jgi:hypothetical protein
MSLQNLANQMQTTGRGGDSMLVHMNPKEVAGLQQLAMAHGGSLTINPETGLPEAGFLSSLLPTIIGAALTIGTGGAINPMTAGLITGAGTGLMTGNLKKGLMAGLGAFGGAGMGAGLMSASSLASTAPALVNNNLGAAFQTAGSTVPASIATTAAPVAAGNTALNMGALNQNVVGAVAPTATTTGAGSYIGVNAGQGVAPVAAVPINPATQIGGASGPPSVFSGIGDRFAQAGSGLKNVLTNQGGAGLNFLNDNKMNLASSLGSAMLTPEEEEKKKIAQAIEMQKYAPAYTRFEPSARAAGSTAERYYLAAEGGMVPGPQESGTVEQMSQMNSVGDNTRYPMASQNTPTYAMPAERPISQNVIYPATDAAVGSYTGMAGGGIASLTSFKRGGKPKAPAAPKSEAQINEENAAKEYAAFAKERAADKARAKAESDKRTAELKKEYTDRISGFNKDTSNELKQKQKDIAGEKDREAKARMQRELKEWQSGRSNELKGIQTDQNNAFKDVTTEYTNRVKDIDNEIRERQALRNFETDVFKKGYTGFSSDIKGDDLGALNKGYDTEIGKQKSEADKAKAALDAAKKTGIQSLIDRAQDMYNTQQGEFEEANKAKEGRINQFREETKRTTSGLTARGDYASTPAAGNNVESLKAQIEQIKKNPAQAGYMGGQGSLSTAQQKEIKDLEGQIKAVSSAKQVYNPKTGQYEADTSKTFKALTKAPTYDTAKKIMEEDDVRTMFAEVAGRNPTQNELAKYLGKNMSNADLAKGVSALSELGIAQKFKDEDLNEQAKYYWGRDMTKGELAYFKDPANKVTNFNALRGAMQNNPAYLQNLNKINQAAFNKTVDADKIAAEGPASLQQVSSAYNDIFGKPPTQDQLQAAINSGATYSQLKAQLQASPEYATKMTQPLVPEIKQTAAAMPAINTRPAPPPISQAQIDAYRQQYNAPTAGSQSAAQLGLAPLFAGTGQGGYTFNQPQQQAAIEGALPYQDVINRLGIGGVYQQIADKAPALQGGVQFNVPQGYTPIGQTARPQGMAMGGMAEGGYNLGGYSDGGRLLRGPGDGVSDSIPASIGNRQPARLADGEFVIPARIVSELGNGSTEAGARQLYAMMDRVQKKRRSTVGKGKVAVNSKAHRMLPA